MHYAHQYLRSAEILCGLYDGSLPLTAFLKQHFSQHKKYGSKDRRHISHLCYTYYRLGRALTDLPFAERARLGLFLCQDEPGIWKELFDSEWLAQWHADAAQRFSFVHDRYKGLSAASIFPWPGAVSDQYDTQKFVLSHLVQPDLFIRIRPGYEKSVKQELSGAGIAFRECGDHCLALPNASRIDSLLAIDKTCVVQDLSSQRVAKLFGRISAEAPMRVWDCCAASGGKSLLAWDEMRSRIQLTVSDVRASIIHNLEKRFRTGGIHADDIFVADLTKPVRPSRGFDLVICDAPCSGSGTWGRTPEQLYFFSMEKIAHYTSLQTQITNNVLPHIKNGGYLLYITCSVFAAENEEIVAKLTTHGMKTIHTEWLKGYTDKADSMFACLLQRTQ